MITPEQVASVAAAGGGDIPLPDGFAAPLALAAARRAPSSWGGVSTFGGQIQIEPNRRLHPHEWRGYGNDIGFVDRMVREDPIIQGLRLALTLPLLSGDWTVEPPPDPDPKEQEATDLARSLLLEQTDGGSWHEHLEHLLTYAWRGWSASEVYWPFDRESGHTRLGLSPILPWTVQQWIPTRAGWALKQLAIQGEYPEGTSPETRRGVRLEPGQYVQIRWMPEADNPEPYGPLRACWADWMARSDYRRLEAQGFLRAAYGTPTVQVDPTVPGFDPSSSTVDAVNDALQEYRSGLRAANIFPPGYRLQIEDFPFRAEQIREAIVQLGHSMMTSVHATFLRTGETRGALSLHDGQVQFFGLTLGAIGSRVASSFNGPDGLLRRLVARNVEGLQRFPWLQPPQVRVGSPVDLVEAVVAAERDGSIVDAGREVEDYLRALIGLPARPEPVPGSEMPGQPKAPGSERTEEIAEEEGDDPAAGEAAGEDVPDPAEMSERYAAIRADEGEAAAEAWLHAQTGPLPWHRCSGLRLSDDRVHGDRLTSGPGGRDLRDEERHISYSETRGRTEAARERMAGIVEEWRQRIADEYAQAVAAAPTLAAARDVPVPGEAELAGALDRELRVTYRAGRESARNERERRGQGGRALADIDIEDIDPEESIRSIVATTVRAAVDRIKTETSGALQGLGVGGLMPALVAGALAVARLVRSLSTGPDRNQAQGDANTIFGLGRTQEQIASGAERFLFSNLLESQTCDPCAALDGTVFGTAELPDFATPYRECEGGDRCNCLVLDITGREEPTE